MIELPAQPVKPHLGWVGMSPERFAFWCAYFSEIRDRLWLGHWQLTVDHHPLGVDDEAMAHVRVIYGQQSARVRLCHDFESYTDDQQRHCVVHELCHLYTDPIMKTINPVRDNLADPADKMLEGILRERIELLTDQMARLVARNLPLPSECALPAEDEGEGDKEEQDHGDQHQDGVGVPGTRDVEESAGESRADAGGGDSPADPDLPIDYYGDVHDDSGEGS